MNVSRSKKYEVRSMRWIFVLFFSLTTYFLLPTSINAQSVDLLWQGESYTPPFYLGRTLWSKQSTITLVAVPQGLGSSASLNYKWSRSGTVLGNINGVGKNTLSFTDSILSKPETFKVEIVSGQNTVLASASVLVTPTSPSLAVYENNPLYGFMFNRETNGTHQLQGREVTFSAFPLFFSIQNRTDNAIGYEWRTNLGTVETKNSVTYRSPDGGTGTSQVQIKATNSKQITQSSDKSFLVQFGK